MERFRLNSGGVEIGLFSVDEIREKVEHRNLDSLSTYFCPDRKKWRPIALLIGPARNHAGELSVAFTKAFGGGQSDLDFVADKAGILRLHSTESDLELTVDLDGCSALEYVSRSDDGSASTKEFEYSAHWKDGSPFPTPRAPGDTRAPARISFTYRESPTLGKILNTIYLRDDIFVPSRTTPAHNKTLDTNT